MTLHVKDGGTWKSVTPYVKDGGSWKQLVQQWVKVAGVWTIVYSNVTFALPGGADADVTFGIDCSMVVTLTSAGAYSVVSTNGTQESGSWISSGAPGSYTIRMHVVSGQTLSGSAVDTDLALSSNRSWSIGTTTAQTLSGTYQLTLKDGGGNTVLTQTFSMTVQRV